MRILFIRHGDPDYENDTLTEKGCREADLLAQKSVFSPIRGMLCISSWKSTAHSTALFRNNWH